MPLKTRTDTANNLYFVIGQPQFVVMAPDLRHATMLRLFVNIKHCVRAGGHYGFVFNVENNIYKYMPFLTNCILLGQ